MTVFDARLVGPLRVVDIVPTGLVDVANVETDAEDAWTKKSVSFLFLFLEVLFAGILVALRESGSRK